VDLLRAKTDLIIALTHQGADEDSILATHINGVDVIVGGHSHTRLRTPKVVNDVIIVQAGSNTENLGILDLTVQGQRVVSHSGRLLPLWASSTRPVTRLGKFVDSLDAVIEREYNVVLGMLEGPWTRSHSGESAVGSYVTEAQRRAVAAEVGFMNIHGIRRDIPAGPITKKLLAEMLPFRNIMTTFQLTGTQLQDVLRYYVTKKPAILIAGINGECTMQVDGNVEFRKITVQGKPLVADRSYICTASDYFMGEAKRYLGFEVQPVIYLHQTLFETVEKAIREDKIIVPHVKDRLILIK
jgi:2',3'-cyclic-nucleotide 2'-phosphodiesterase (5'-nucleotidase family)